MKCIKLSVCCTGSNQFKSKHTTTVDWAIRRRRRHRRCFVRPSNHTWRISATKQHEQFESLARIVRLLEILKVRVNFDLFQWVTRFYNTQMVVSYRPKKFTLKAFKRYWFTCRDLYLRMYKTAEDANSGAMPVHSVNLKGCEVTPDVNISQNKFGIKLEVPSSDGMTEMCIRCETVSVPNTIRAHTVSVCSKFL